MSGREQALRERLGLVGVDDVAVEPVSVVGHDRADLPLVAIQPGGEELLVIHPEGLVELAPQDM